MTRTSERVCQSCWQSADGFVTVFSCDVCADHAELSSALWRLYGGEIGYLVAHLADNRRRLYFFLSRPVGVGELAMVRMLFIRSLARQGIRVEHGPPSGRVFTSLSVPGGPVDVDTWLDAAKEVIAGEASVDKREASLFGFPRPA